MSAVVEQPSSDAVRAAVRAQVEAAGTSFYWAMRLLPEARREAMFAIYAFCREADDIADSDAPAAAKSAQLDEWRREIDAVFAGRPGRPLGRLLADAVAAYRLRRADFLAVIDGMEMDARQDIRAPSLDELDLYCDRVASAVGRLSVRAFGCDLDAADHVAHHLGRALQLTNILRDLAEDAARGRLYLPRELLERAGVPLGAPEAVLRHPGLPAACNALADRAAEHFVEARAAMALCPRRPMRPAAVMSAVYHALLLRLRRHRWTALDERVSVPTPIKLWLAIRHGLL